MPVVENISLEDIQVKNSSQYVILANGYSSSPIRNILLNNVAIEQVNEAFSLENVEGL
ncbi:MAG: hypothetical protein OEM26_05600 [Saprospiraceae bacterium]|nr:hypothetical protein [Saprospiraceae bacterium]